MTTIRFGILGAAFIAPIALLGPARENPDVTVAAIAARDPRKAQKFAQRHRIPYVHESYEDVLADSEINAVYVPLPNSLHAEWTIRALRAGKHVLCEKPLAANALEAEAMEQVADETGHVLCEAFHYRYHPLVTRMKGIVDSGELGKLQHIDATLALPVPPGNIRYRYSLAGGATMDLGCYLINLARFLTGAEPTVEEARAGLVSPQIDRWMHISLRFPSGVTAHLDCSFFSRRLLTGSVLVRGECGEMRVFNPTLPHLLYHRLTVRTTHGQRHEQVSKRSTFAYQLEAFVKAVRGENTLPTTAHDAVANMRVIDAVYLKAGLRPRGS